MKISVVIPARNEEKYIEKTLQAVLAQNHSDFEVIVVNNGSSDETTDIVSKFAGKVKLLEEKGKGVQRAREKGRRESHGELIASLDADCLPEKDWLSLAETYFSDPNVVAITGPYYFYDGGVIFRPISLFVQKVFYKLISIFLNYFNLGAILIAGNCIIKARALEKIGGYNVSILFYGDDTDTAKRVSKLGKVIFSNRLIMKTSARRFKTQGLFKTFFLYIFYFFRRIFNN